MTTNRNRSAMNKAYEFMDLASIDPNLICVICSEPFENPHCTVCDHTFCYHCITTWINKRNTTCPTCRQNSLSMMNLTPASRTLRNILNGLRVKCMLCGIIELQLGNIDDHVNRLCNSVKVSCSAVDMKCPWTGTRDQLKDHINICALYQLQPLLSDWFNEVKQLKEQIIQQRTQIDALKIENQNQKIEMTHTNQRCIQMEQQIKRIQEENQIEKTNKVQTNQNYESRRSETHGHDSEHRSQQYNTGNIMNRSSPVSTRAYSNSSKVISAPLTTTTYQMKQGITSHTDMTPVHLKISASVNTARHNPTLDESIAADRPDSEWDLQSRNITDQDVPVIIKNAIVQKRYSELVLCHNSITSEGVLLLAKALHNNKTLNKLQLHDNLVLDKGAQYLAQVLSLNNSNLSTLNLGKNGITDEGVKCIVEMLKVNTKLIRLELDENEITDGGVNLLANVLIQPNAILKVLYLYLNHLVTDQCVDVLIRMIKDNRSLQVFYIGGCSLSQSGRKRLQEAAKEKKKFKFECEQIP